ncbi:hypothetical protein BH10PLA1_BH10PLA1_14080 [soil metagenome]
MLSRLKILLIPTVALVLGAGMVIGRISTKLPATSQPTTQPGRWFDEQLNLSADQRKQMESIWGDVRQNMGKTFENRDAISKERDAAVQSLLTPEQKIAYDKIYETYRAKRDDMDKQREKLFADANLRSRAILSPEQQKRWDALSQEHHGWGGGPRRGGPRGPGGPGSQPSTRPSTRPAGADRPGF